MSHPARGLIGGALAGASILGIAMLSLPLQWIVAFFATTTLLTLVALGLEMWRAPRAVHAAESRSSTDPRGELPRILAQRD